MEGNGRDSIYFSKNNLQVLGIDLESSNFISNLKKYEDKNLLFDIVDVKKYRFMNMFDNLYLRFLLYAIRIKEDAFIKMGLYKVNKYIFIENRIFEDYKTKLNTTLEAKEVIESKIEKIGI